MRRTTKLTDHAMKNPNGPSREEIDDWNDALADREAERGSVQRSVRHQPRRKTCPRCQGKKWFGSAIGDIACQSCDASGKGGIDVEWLVKDWQRLKQLEAKRVQPEYLSEALNSGDGTYKP